jgi:hypothetical protein
MAEMLVDYSADLKVARKAVQMVGYLVVQTAVRTADLMVVLKADL